MSSKLIINNIEIPVLREIPISLNLSIADIRNIDKRGGSASKSIIIPSTGVVDVLFEDIFRLNIELSTFNPNLKSDAIYYVNEKEQFKGDLQLLNITDLPNGAREYKCNIIGREGSFFVALGDSYLTDLTWTDLNHTFNKTNQKASWTPTLGVGYVYPLIKYGYSASDTSYDVNHFKPAIFAKEYIDRIFAAAGYSYTSSFFTSTFFKRVIIPCNLLNIQLSNSAINATQYYIGKTPGGTLSFISGSTNGSNLYSGSVLLPNFKYDLETSPYFDSSNQYDSVTNFYATLGISGTYNIVARSQFDVTVNAGTLPGGKYSITFRNITDIQFNSGSGWYGVATYLQDTTSTLALLGTATSCQGSTQTGNMLLGGGTLIRVINSVQVINISLYNAANVGQPSTAFTVDLAWTTGTYNSHYILNTGTSVIDGNSLDMVNAIPKTIKQKDFIKWLFQCFNLYVELDKTNDTNLIIEPRDDFYSNNINDWTYKIDYSKPFDIKPMGELDSRSYIFKYKNDNDYYNDLYSKTWIDNYGLERVNVVNDFIKNEKVTEVGFSPTPLISNSSNDIICPHIYQKDGSTLKPANHNLRLLYWGGLKNSGNSWTFTGTLSGTTTETQYPYAGHVDDPQTPTVDLNFGFPKEVYYTFMLAYYTNNNLYNKYYSKFVNEITDKDSKLITCSVMLNEVDVKNFSFRDKVFINHPVYGPTYYIVNKIIDYNPLEEKPCKVELLKLKNYSAFVPSNIPIDSSYDPVSSSRIVYNPNTNDNVNSNYSNTLSIGNNNRVFGSGNSVTGGSGNFISEDCIGVSLINCNNVSCVGVTNFVGVGISNITIDSTYNNTTLDINQKKTQLTISGSDPLNPTVFNYDNKVDVYYVDRTGGDVTLLFDKSTIGTRNVTIIVIDASAYKFRIDEVSGTPTVIGNALPYDTGMIQYDSIELTYNNNVFYIKG